MSKFDLVSKISVKKVMGAKPRAPEPGKSEMLMQVIGVATGTKVKDTDFGQSIALLGSFQATNLKTGKVYRSGVCYLPNLALDLIAPQLSDKDTKAVEFAFNIGVVYDEGSATSYVYFAEPVIAPGENDPLEMLTKKLPAPEDNKKLAAPEDVKEGKKKTA